VAIEQLAREMTLPRGSVAFSISFERSVETKNLTTGQASPSKVRQTIIALRDGKLMSLLTEPDLGTSRAEALSGGTIDLVKDVMIRSAA
jgi:hypothetical protein